MLTLPVARPAGRLPASRVRTVMVALTDFCNLDCLYCFVHKTPRRMSAETAEKVVEFLHRRDLAPTEKPLQVNFFGGEPFLEGERMAQIMAGCRRERPNLQREFRFSATTNGTLWGPRLEALVRDHRMTLLVSLDGGPAANRERPFASGRPSYAAVVRNLPRMVEASPDVVVRATFPPGGLDLAERVQALLDLGASAVSLCPVADLPWEGREEAVERAFDRLAEWYLERSGPRSVPPLEVTNQLLRLLHQVRKGGSRPARPCPVGESLLGVDPDGHVMPCHRFLYRPQDWLGTVERPEVQGEKRRPYLELDSSRFAECEGCAAREVCGGGCRSVALAKGKELHQPQPGHCIPMRAHHRAVVRIYDALKERGWLGAALEGRRAGAVRELALR